MYETSKIHYARILLLGSKSAHACAPFLRRNGHAWWMHHLNRWRARMHRTNSVLTRDLSMTRQGSVTCMAHGCMTLLFSVTRRA